MSGVALVTGASGQDGFYLLGELLAAGRRVIGTTRDVAAALSQLGPTLTDRVELVAWDLVDTDRFGSLLRKHRPTEIYNLAAFTSGEFMDRHPERVTDINGVAVLRMLEAIRAIDPAIRFCQASSSEVFAASGVSPQDEGTPRAPRSVYGAAKILADQLIALYRDKYGLFACSAFLFNHESPRRGEGFVTQKIVQAAARIKLGRREKLLLGDLSAARDWGFAGDVARAMRLMLGRDEPRDYVLATGVAHTVADLCALAFGRVGLDWRDHIGIDLHHVRAAERAPIIGNISRARTELGWAPSISFERLIGDMVDSAMRAVGASEA